MNWKARLAARLPLDDDVLEELAQHAASTYAAARADGLPAADAIARVDAQIEAWLANPALLRRRGRRAPAVTPPSGSGGRLTSIPQDVRYALRLLGREPVYAALVVATMALGIAATTTIGSVAYGVLLKPLPWADAPRLVRLYETRQGSTRRFNPMMTNAAFLAWRESPSATLDAIEAWSGRRAVIGSDEQPERVQTAAVTAGLLDVVGARPLLGRLFLPQDAETGRPRVVVLSYGFWQERFGGAADVVGRTLRVGGTPHTIVGVTPASFMFPDRATRAWTPFIVVPMVSKTSPAQSIQLFQALGRLRPGVTPEQAAAEGSARGRTVPSRGPVVMAVFGSDGAVEVSAIPMLQALTRDVRPAIGILFVAVLLLLATATANAASLQLARASVRRRELAIRAALGAGRGRLVRQTLVENLLLGLLGGAAGLALAALMHRALPALLPADFPRVDDLVFDWRIQAFAILVSILAGLGCGLLPALHAARGSVVPALVEDSLAPVGGGMRTGTARARAFIMAAQVAIASVLLVGALLLVRSFTAMTHANLGYDGTNVLSARLILADRLFSEERRVQIVQDILGRISGMGVTRAAAATALPFTGGEMLSSFPVKKRDGSTVQVQSGSRQVTAGYFAALGQRVVEGREFTAADATTGGRVAIVNREFSRRYLDGRALGWTLPGADNTTVAIVGVVEDTARNSVGDAAQPDVYFPMAQRPLYASDIHLVVRTADDPARIVPALRAVVRQAAPAAPLESIMTMEDRVSESLAKPRLYAVLLGTFALFALAIAGVGLFGVLSYSVAQRAREIGVRSALGAQVRDIVALVVRQSMAIAITGLAIGLLTSLWLTSALQRYLYGVAPRDAASFAAVAFVLLAVAAIASVVPARRAARVDPVRVLRS
ncbi:MAG TPA: ABC transporter permease [Vicinamibacterales bacterium]|nr:ABC transporter permease [Vicinamibacterales bacterium]